MISLIVGQNGSGKSEFAELLLTENGITPYYYVAAMIPYGEEAQKKIERHHKLRADKGFITIEKYWDVSDITVKESGSILLECLSNLTANEMFDQYPDRNMEWYIEKIAGDIINLSQKTAHLYIVGNDLFADGTYYDDMTEQYIKILAQIQNKITQFADEVIEVVSGIPVYIKKGQLK